MGNLPRIRNYGELTVEGAVWNLVKNTVEYSPLIYKWHSVGETVRVSIEYSVSNFLNSYEFD